MKKLLSFCAFAIFACSGAAFAQTTANVQEQAQKKETSANPLDGTVKFKEETIDFGTAKLNKPVTVEFEFTNKSNAPLIIQSAQPSCGCTTPDWTKEPVMPGKSGKVTATYNAAGLGAVNKTVFVNFKGISQTVELHLKGTVEK